MNSMNPCYPSRDIDESSIPLMTSNRGRLSALLCFDGTLFNRRNITGIETRLF